jgi:hypothetical protein
MAYGTTYQLQPWVTGNTNTSVTYSVPPTIDGITPNAWPTGASVSATGLITAPPAVTVETSQPASIPPTTYLAIQSAVDPTAEVWMQVEFIPKSGDGKIRLAAGYVSGPRYGPDASGFYWWGTNPAPAALSYLAAQGGSCQINYKSYIPNRLAMGPFAHYCGGTWNSIHAGTGASAGWGTGTSQPTDYLLNTTSINALGSPQTGSGGDIHFKLVVPPGDYAVTLYGEPGGAAPTSASSNAVIAPNDVVFDYELQGSSSMAVTCTPIPCASASRSNNPPQGLDTYLLANSGWNLWQMTANTTVGSNGILDIAARGRRILGFTPRMASVLIAPVAATSFTISGAITGAPNSSQGILVTLTGPAGTGSTTQTTFTGTGGSYTFSVLVPGSYTIAPTLAGWTFTPASIPVTVSTANLTGQNFTALPVPAGLSIGHIGPHP